MGRTPYISVGGVAATVGTSDARFGFPLLKVLSAFAFVGISCVVGSPRRITAPLAREAAAKKKNINCMTDLLEPKECTSKGQRL